jgi:H+/gluconate symporter-like permease
MAVGTIIVIVAVVLAALDMILWYTTEYRRHVLLQLAVIALGVALLIGAPNIGS